MFSGAAQSLSSIVAANAGSAGAASEAGAAGAGAASEAAAAGSGAASWVLLEQLVSTSATATIPAARILRCMFIPFAGDGIHAERMAL